MLIFSVERGKNFNLTFRYTLDFAKDVPELPIKYSLMILIGYEEIYSAGPKTGGKFFPVKSESDENLTPKLFSFRKPV